MSHKWYKRAWSYDFNLHRSYFDPHIGNNYETFLLAVAVGLLFWALAGGVIVFRRKAKMRSFWHPYLNEKTSKYR
jgi:hypothetical protein